MDNGNKEYDLDECIQYLYLTLAQSKSRRQLLRFAVQ